MPTLPAGDYLIKNEGSSAHVTINSLGTRGSSKQTEKKKLFLVTPASLEDITGDFSFHLSYRGGDRYVITSNSVGLKIGVNSALKNRMALNLMTMEHEFEIMDAGSGVFTVRPVGYDKVYYWHHHDDGSDKLENLLTLSTTVSRDENYFLFQATSPTASSDHGSYINEESQSDDDEGPNVADLSLETGIFDTDYYRDWTTPALENRTMRKFANGPLQQTPKLIVGLRRLDFDWNYNLRVESRIEKLTEESFTLNLYSWSDTVNYGTGASWLRLPSGDRNIQGGTFEPKDDADWIQKQKKCVHRIYFPYLYSTAPNVVVFFHSLDVEQKTDIQVKVSATSVQADSFAINIEYFGKTGLHSAGISWFAYPKDMKRISSGTFRRDNGRQQLASDDIFFPSDCGFDKKPEVFVALNELDIRQQEANIRVRLSTSDDDATAKGIKWHLDTWSNSVGMEQSARLVVLIPLTTSPAPEEFDESYSFYVKTVSGQLAVFTSSYKSYIAALSDITKEGAPLVWRKGEQVFQISSVTTADQVYNIRATTSDLYWSDKEVENQPYRVVFLKKGSDTDENHWRILPAA
ncbi:hypothetical protein D9757_004931 [Collybiopsis confluens]|uniref:H-type lectin domain-containing protein n=1 Tax=Collybiopsis confluens TaxID=2823264 RepID=A0A8H5MCX8_9AGAR|nr:hypothetical protein D9757_004931 [Collybiopsis confluens]